MLDTGKKTAAANYRVNAQGKEWEFLQIGNINKTAQKSLVGILTVMYSD